MEKYFDSDDEFHSVISELKAKENTMSEKDVFRQFLMVRPKIFDECYWQLEEYDNEFSSYISNHLVEAINFIKNDCTADEFSWMSEIWDDVVKKTKSKEFVDCIKATAKKFPEECAKYNIQGSIDDAESYLS